MKQDIRDMLVELEKMTGHPAEYVPDGTKHRRVRIIIEHTPHEFAIPKFFKRGTAKDNFYSWIKKRIRERKEMIQTRQEMAN